MYWFTHPVEVRFRDTDGFGHVNNAVYLTYFELVRVAYGLHLGGGERIADVQFILGELSVRYLKPIFFGDAIVAAARISRFGSKSFGMDYELRRANEVVTSGTSTLIWYDYKADRSVAVPDTFRARVAEVQGETL